MAPAMSPPARQPACFWRLAVLAAAFAIGCHAVDKLPVGGVAAETLPADFEPISEAMPTDLKGTGSSKAVPAAADGDKCTKCNVPVDQGGCKCDNNCDCLSSGGIGAFFSAADFAQFFLHTNDGSCKHPGFYTYTAFATAAAAFPGFGTAASAAVNKREIAAFMGQVSHETTGGWATAPDGPYAWGLCFDEENTPAAYCAPSDRFPCNSGQTYHGRGPIQLSWNYKYIPAGEAIGFDGLNNPGAVPTDAVIAWKTAIWFWMTPSGNKPSCHAVMTGAWSPSAVDTAANRFPGFGVVTNIVNGGLECGSGHPSTGAGPDRIGYFKRYAGILDVDTGGNLSCDNQHPF